MIHKLLCHGELGPDSKYPKERGHSVCKIYNFKCVCVL